MAKYLVVSTSGNPDSNSRRMGRIAFRHLEKAKVDCEWLDISELDLPLCDADACYAQPGSQRVGKKPGRADWEGLGRKGGRFPVRRWRNEQLHVGHGVRQQSHA